MLKLELHLNGNISDVFVCLFVFKVKFATRKCFYVKINKI